MADPKPKRIPGTPPEGWTKRQFYAPKVLVREFERVRDTMPGQVHKHMCTASVALFVALPAAVQLRLYQWAHANELDIESLNSAETLKIVLDMLKKGGH